MKLPLCDYSELIFDCDGVVLNSKKIKTEAFYQPTLSFGKLAVFAMVDHHKNDSISQYEKIKHFLEHIVTTAAHDAKSKKVWKIYLPIILPL